MAAHDLPDLKALPEQLRNLQAQLGYRARWAPIYVEPMVGSGERFTFAIAARGDNGEVKVETVIRPEVLRVLYGPKARYFGEMLAAAASSVEDALAAGGEDVHFGVQGFVIGRFRAAVGRSMRDIVEQGRAVCASLAMASAEEQQAAEAEDDERETGLWSRKIQAHVTETARDLGEFFGRDWTPKGRTIPSHFGFFNGTYAANFGVVRKDNPAASLYHLKPRLWDLAQAQSDHFTEIRGRDLLLAMPKLAAATVSIPTRDRVRDVVDKVKSEADRYQIYVLHTDRVDVASRRLYEQARRLAA